MPIKIRLQRRGRKGIPFYTIGIADSRSPRDGKLNFDLGCYNPLTKNIKLFINNTIFWLEKGAQPTNKVRYLLSKIGALYKKHLLEGARIGAFDNQEAENRFIKWIEQNKNIYVNKSLNLLVFVKEK